MMLFNRFDCLLRAAKRYRKYRNNTRPDMGKGCNEKLDGDFVTWILWRSRRKAARDRYKRWQKQYADKVIVLKNQKQLDAFMKQEGL